MEQKPEDQKVKKYGNRETVFQGMASMTKGKPTKEDSVFQKGIYKSKKAIERGKSMRQGTKVEEVKKSK